MLQSTPSFLRRSKKRSQAIGVTRGGLNTKIHALRDALGNPLRFILSPGNVHDCEVAPTLIKDCEAGALLADKGYDSNTIVAQAKGQEMEVIIPSKSNRKEKRPLDPERYDRRHLVENLFQRMKIFRRIATRFEKLDVNFMGFVCLAGMLKWLH